MLTIAFGDYTTSRTLAQLWYNRFKEGQDDVKDNSRRDRPSTSTTNETFKAVKEWISIIVESLLYGPCQSIFTKAFGIQRAAATMKSKPNHINGSVHKSQDRKKQFSLIAMAWCIMNSCHKIKLSIRNTTFKLGTHCAKEFIRNAWNCRKPIVDFALW